MILKLVPMMHIDVSHLQGTKARASLKSSARLYQDYVLEYTHHLHPFLVFHRKKLDFIGDEEREAISNISLFIFFFFFTKNPRITE